MAGWHHRCNGHEFGETSGDIYIYIYISTYTQLFIYMHTCIDILIFSLNSKGLKTDVNLTNDILIA